MHRRTTVEFFYCCLRFRAPRNLLGRRRFDRLAGGSIRRLLETVSSPELLAEALDATRGVNEFLLAGKERMTSRTDIDSDARQRAAGGKRVAASAVN